MKSMGKYVILLCSFGSVTGATNEDKVEWLVNIWVTGPRSGKKRKGRGKILSDEWVGKMEYLPWFRSGWACVPCSHRSSRIGGRRPLLGGCE